MKIGILGIHEEYWPFLTTLIKEFGHEPVLGKTNKEVIGIGTKYAENEQCVATKIAIGQAVVLSKKTDLLFIPHLVSIMARTWTCPKWLGLYDMIKVILENEENVDPKNILCPTADSNSDIGFVKAIKRVTNPTLAANIAKIKRFGLTSMQVMGLELGKKLRIPITTSLPAIIKAQKAQNNCWIKEQKKQLSDDPRNIKILVVGHPYLVNDAYLNFGLIEKIKSYGDYRNLPDEKKEKIWGVDVITTDSVPEKIWKKYAELYERKHIFWSTHRKMLGSLLYLLDSNKSETFIQNNRIKANKLGNYEIDGVVFLTGAFCGEDALMELIQNYVMKRTGISFTRITLDEHAAEAGVITRIEAYIDTMVKNKQRGISRKTVAIEQMIPKKKLDIPKNPVVSCPNLGYSSIAIKVFCDKLGVPFIESVPTTSRSTEMAHRYCPEFACRPFGTTLGNMLMTLERRPDVNIFFQGSGSGPCKYGNYQEVQQIVLENLGLNTRILPVRPPSEAGIREFFRSFSVIDPQARKSIGREEILAMTKRFFSDKKEDDMYKDQKQETLWLLIKQGFFALRGLDQLYKESLVIKPFEAKEKSTEKALKEAQALFLNIGKANISEIPTIISDAFNILRSIPASVNLGNPEEMKEAISKLPKLVIVGEFYEVLASESNYDIANYFGSHGVYVERAIHGSDWLDPYRKNIVAGTPRKEIAKLAKPYLSFCGGDGQDTIGDIVHYMHKGFDGVVAIRPLGCMPETVAAQIIPYLPKYGIKIPVLIVTFDQQVLNSANLITRLEAFSDQMNTARKLNIDKKELMLV